MACHGLAFKWPGSAGLVLAAHEVQESLKVCLSIAWLRHICHLLQLLQVLTILFNLSQALLQGHILQAPSAGKRVKVWRSVGSDNQTLSLGGLQEMVVRTGSVHCCTIGCDGSCACGDCSNRAGAKRVDVQKVLAVNDNQIDEGHNLTDVGHSTTNVDGAKRLRDALEHIEG
eukprot:Skav213756  [mRNA]  locus=scaffold771:7143:8084:+ [translate_table: standard]